MKRQDSSSESERAVTPPTYQVQETKDGRLVNPLLGVQWPHHPPGNKAVFDGYVLKRPMEPPLRHSAQFQPSRSIQGRDRNGRFIGPSTLAAVNELLRYNDFLIFYPMPDIQHGDDLPLETPLLMAYKNSHEKIYYLPIKFENRRWQVQLPTGPHHLNFKTMQGLIEYYLTYGFLDQATKKVEVFRLNALENFAD